MTGPLNTGRPSQAVILAGGRGTRLAPLTDTRPKPMIEFHGKPFLEYLINLLKDQGFTRVVLLLGYLPDVIRNHFGDGSHWGLEIQYSVGPEADETGRRIKRTLPLLDPVFLLMYCDNYWPMRFDRMWGQFSAAAPQAMVTVYDNGDRSSRDNLRIDREGFVEIYDKSRTAPDLRGVDIGFLLLRRELIESFPEGNLSFEATLYPELVARRQIMAHVTSHKYYSVGDLKRLLVTETFLRREPAIILDRDGVLNAKMPKAEYVRSWADWQWEAGAREAIALLTTHGYRIIVVTNQAGVARGVMTERDLADIHDAMKRDVEAAGGRIEAIYHCPHGWDDGCDCRKPKPGMLFQAQRDFHLDLSRVFFVGDDSRDGEAAEAAGCPFQRVTPETPLITIATRLINAAAH